MSSSQSNCTTSSPTSSLSQFSSSSSLSSKNHHHHHPHRQHHHRQQHHQSDPHCQHHNSHHHHHQVTREFTQCSRTWVFKPIHCLIIIIIIMITMVILINIFISLLHNNRQHMITTRAYFTYEDVIKKGEDGRPNFLGRKSCKYLQVKKSIYMQKKVPNVKKSSSRSI